MFDSDSDRQVLYRREVFPCPVQALGQLTLPVFAGHNRALRTMFRYTTGVPGGENLPGHKIHECVLVTPGLLFRPYSASRHQ